ncbi:YwdI family protein [Mammaliicoccus sciuri]|nr:YwdI family protein [Mammaliicoccus sciuri]
MISRSQLIAAIEEELVAADNASTNEVFNRHMHAIHTLSGLVDKEDDLTHDIKVEQNIFFFFFFFSSTPKPTPKAKPQISDEEIRKMGGKVRNEPSVNKTENQLTTDDGIGNGDSIFDF